MDTLVLMAHGSRDADAVRELADLGGAVRAAHGGPLEMGVLEFPGALPSIQEAFDRAVASGARKIVGQPLLLFCGDHNHGDMPEQVALLRSRHPGVQVSLGSHLGIHDDLLDIVGERAAAALESLGAPSGDTALLLVGRGTYRPEANADLFKIARLCWERLQPHWGLVEAAFVSLAPPGVPEGLRRCAALGARRVVVVPYFLNTGTLVKRIAQQAAETARELPGVQVAVAAHLGLDPRCIGLILRRTEEAARGLPAVGYAAGGLR